MLEKVLQVDKVLQRRDFLKEELEKCERELEAIQNGVVYNPVSDLVGKAFNKYNKYISFDEIVNNVLYVTEYTLYDDEIEVRNIVVDIESILFTMQDTYSFSSLYMDFTGYKEVDRSVIDTIIEYGIELDEKLEEFNEYTKSKILELKSRLS